MDDIVILTSTEEEGLERLRRIFQVAKDYGLDIKKKKCQLLKTKIEFLGFIIDDGRVQPSNDKTLAIKNYPQPTTLKQIQSFLGLTGYFRRRNGIAYRCEQIWLWSLSVAEVNEDGRFHPVYYMSKKTTPAEEKYSSYELEVLAIIQAKTMAKKDLTTRVARLALLLEEYSYEIEHRKGNKMSHVNALSRHPNVMTMTLTKEDGVVERLRQAQELDEHILAIKKILSTEDYEDFFVKSDILYKFVNGRELIVVPKMMQTDIIKKAHEIGHFALPKTEEVVTERKKKKKECYIQYLNKKDRCIHIMSTI
ncbi:hypothetical protein JTB14_021332 [Gonioctena quinquepunctata]|nr:hypothetical protein JTB14_021332 [Gonioctena quinquepunctata]